VEVVAKWNSSSTRMDEREHAFVFGASDVECRGASSGAKSTHRKRGRRVVNAAAAGDDARA